MSRQEAPLYVAAHDLAGWLLGRVADWPAVHEPLRVRVVNAGCSLVEAVSLALTFPDIRPAQVQEADASVVRLRVLVRLAGEVALLSARQVRFVAGRLLEIGRMLGGWRKRVGVGPLVASTG